MSDQDRKDDLDILDISEEDETSKEPSDETSEEKTKDEKTTEEDYDKDTEYEDVCFICRRPESKAGRMFKLPNHISVCSDCMHKTMDTVSQFDYQGLLNSTSNMNNDKKERRRHYSLDACVYEGIVYASEDKNLTAIFETDSKFGRLTEAIKYLSDKQKSLIQAVYFDGMSVSDYAKHMGISQSAVSQQLKTIYKKLKKFL